MSFLPYQYDVLLGAIVDIRTCLPPFDPDRWQTCDGLADPENTNARKIATAADALEQYRAVVDPEASIEFDESRVEDLICDLLHLVHYHGVEPLKVLSRAVADFQNEACVFDPSDYAEQE